MALTVDDVRKMAALSRLRLTDDELHLQRDHINALLTHVDSLMALDLQLQDSGALEQPIVEARADVAMPSLTRERCLANAPASRDGYFVVPRIIDA